MTINSWEKRGSIFREAREKRGLKQEDVARLINKGVSTISNYETGKKKIDFDIIKKMCNFFEIDIAEL